MSVSSCRSLSNSRFGDFGLRLDVVQVVVVVDKLAEFGGAVGGLGGHRKSSWVGCEDSCRARRQIARLGAPPARQEKSSARGHAKTGEYVLGPSRSGRRRTAAPAPVRAVREGGVRDFGYATHTSGTFARRYSSIFSLHVVGPGRAARTDFKRGSPGRTERSPRAATRPGNRSARTKRTCPVSAPASTRRGNKTYPTLGRRRSGRVLCCFTNGMRNPNRFVVIELERLPMDLLHGGCRRAVSWWSNSDRASNSSTVVPLSRRVRVAMRSPPWFGCARLAHPSFHLTPTQVASGVVYVTSFGGGEPQGDLQGPRSRRCRCRGRGCSARSSAKSPRIVPPGDFRPVRRAHQGCGTPPPASRPSHTIATVGPLVRNVSSDS